MDNKASITFSIIDDATKTIKQIEKNVLGSTSKMTDAEAKYTKEIAHSSTKLYEMRIEQLNASKERKKQLNDEIKALRLKLQLEKEALRTERSNNKPNINVAGGAGKGTLGGLSTGMMSKAGAIGAGVAAIYAVGEQVYNVTDKVMNAQDIWRQRVQGTTADYRSLGEQTLKISNVFGKTNEEIARAGNAFAKAYGIDAKEGLDIVYEGFKKGADMNGMFLDNLTEYSVQAKEAGATTQEFIQFLIESEKRGIYSDKGIDSLKEAKIALNENNKALQAALKPLGDAVNLQIKQKVEAGDTFGAMQLISTSVKDMGLNAQQTQMLMSELFKSAGEDAGLQLLDTFDKVNGRLETTKDNLSENQKATIKLKEEWSSFEASIGEVFDGWIINAKRGILDLIDLIDKTGLIDFMGKTVPDKKRTYADMSIEELKQLEKNKRELYKNAKTKEESDKARKDADYLLKVIQKRQLEKDKEDALKYVKQKNAGKNVTTNDEVIIKTKTSNSSENAVVLKTENIEKENNVKTQTISDRTTNLSEQKLIRSLNINIDKGLYIDNYDAKMTPEEFAKRLNYSLAQVLGNANAFSNNG